MIWLQSPEHPFGQEQWHHPQHTLSSSAGTPSPRHFPTYFAVQKSAYIVHMTFPSMQKYFPSAENEIIAPITCALSLAHIIRRAFNRLCCFV